MEIITRDMRLLLAALSFSAVGVAMAENNLKAPGWDAIDARFKGVYGDQQPKHWAPPLHPPLSGKLLFGISVYRGSDSSHWHYVTYGGTDLYEKTVLDDERSGFGFELTFRLFSKDTSGEPPGWPISMLDNITAYVARTGNAFDVNHVVPFNGPILVGSSTRIVAATFVLDPELGEMGTANGHVKILQLVGLCQDEFDAINDWNAEKVVPLLKATSPLLATDLDRRSIRDDQVTNALILRGIETDGSSRSAELLETLNWTLLPADSRGVVVQINKRAAPNLAKIVPGRLGFGRPLTLMGKSAVLQLIPAESSAWTVDKDELHIHVSRELAKRMAETFKSVPSTASWADLPGLSFELQEPK